MISPPARHFLNSTFVNVASLRASRASRWSRSTPTTRARGIAAATGAVFNDRGELPLQGRGERAARGPAWSTAWACGGASWALDGTNVNELTTSG
jgi:hypothetical protein